jgi:arsenite methyltransferase
MIFMEGKTKELENPYFDLQAEMGSTKHGGGLKATQEFIEFCHIDKDKYVLDVGCGVGATTCYIAKKTGCRVVGIDIRKRMVEVSRERARREGLGDRVEFRVADAQKLPFGSDIFDVVASESVTAFVKDKKKAISEYTRVAKPGGYVWLNETTWVKDPPPEMARWISRSTGGAAPETPDRWKGLLEGSGLDVVLAKRLKFSPLSQAINEMRMIGLSQALRGAFRILSLYIKSPAHRKAVHNMAMEARKMPRSVFEYWGTGIYVGKKML